ncbi:zinc finger BED domain-containing protein DAYSLEEPER-like [Neltuma alba]|uniref:zinc finger BED domain-containing protein DAYSLEEPER-like n=1 Tax=Neltuma alba TaxID=207710 RepID=UPI0010A331EB|nr:zinc finger BED domain-containing protein DAYSLEEPER-like [Prosopis alba]
MAVLGLTVNNTAPPKKRAKATLGLGVIPFDQERCNNEVAKMIIAQDYPLQIVEHKGFIDFVRTLQPQFSSLSSTDVHGDCMSMYLSEKQNLLNLIRQIPGRVNLTLDLWTSNQTVGYAFLRGHFIDSDWNVHHPILNVILVPFPDSDDSYNKTIVTCLTDWQLEGRLFTLTLDQSSNETLMGNLRGLLSVRNPVIFNGQLLSRNCFARVLSRLALDALWTMRETISKVRESVKLVKISKSNENKFIKLRQKLQVPCTKDLFIDSQTKWDTTYHMLVAACELKEVFACFETSGHDYGMTLSMDEWKQVEILCTYLKQLYDAANLLTCQPYPTANLFFSVVSNLLVELTRAAFSHDPFLSNLIRPLQERFDQYWRESSLVLAAAAAMDPRYKMECVELTFGRIFGENAEPWIRVVEDGLHELLHEYIVELLPLTTTDGNEGNEIMIKTEPYQEGSLDGSIIIDTDGLSDLEIYISDITGNQIKSELDQYLEEPLLPRVEEFDILSWWRLNTSNYPTLSRVASDILSMPLSTLPAESVFDTEIRKMESYRSSLSSMTIEALFCAKDWLHYQSLPIDVPMH